MKTLVMILLNLLSIHAFAKFSGPYPDSPDFPIIIQQAFMRLTEKKSIPLNAVPNTCKVISLDNKTALADFDLLTGFPYATTINPSFWKWYFDCIESYANNTLLNSEDGFKNALGEASAKYFSDKPLVNIKEALWQSVPPDQRLEISRSIIKKLIREDLLAEFGDNPQKIMTEIDITLNNPSRNQFKVEQAILVILQTVLKQKSFIME